MPSHAAPRSLGSRLGLVVVALLASAVCIAPASARVRAGLPRSSPIHVLFIGNSYTRSNNLPNMVRRIADGVADAASFQVTAIANPGWDLHHHWYVDETRQMLTRGGFTHVVLQGHSLTALQHRDEFEGYARLFDGEIDRTGARTVLYETWARSPRSGAYRPRRVPHPPIAASPFEMQARVTECYSQLARALDADLAPAGRAFLLAQERVRDAELFRSDGAHPSPTGTFLAASVIYATVAHDDPRRSEWRPYPMSRRMASELRDVAYLSVSSGR